GAASQGRASTHCHPLFDAAPTELMRSGRGFYNDVGPTGLRSRLRLKMWVMLRLPRRFGGAGEDGMTLGPKLCARPLLRKRRSSAALQKLARARSPLQCPSPD